MHLPAFSLALLGSPSAPAYFRTKDRLDTVFRCVVADCGFARFSTFNMSLVAFLILEYKYAFEHYKW